MKFKPLLFYSIALKICRFFVSLPRFHCHWKSFKKLLVQCGKTGKCSTIVCVQRLKKANSLEEWSQVSRVHGEPVWSFVSKKEKNLYYVWLYEIQYYTDRTAHVQSLLAPFSFNVDESYISWTWFCRMLLLP